MAHKSFLLRLVVFCVAMALFPNSSYSAQKVTAGKICKVYKQKIVYQNKTYTCLKSGKKFVWSKGVRVLKVDSTPTLGPINPSPSPTASQSTPTAIGDPVGAIGSENAEADASARASAERVAAYRATLSQCAHETSCKVGNIGPGGGIVFYAAQSRQSWGQYLEVAPATWSAAYSDPYRQWCTLGDTLLIALVTDDAAVKNNSEKIGAGKENTALMLSSCMQGIAQEVHAYSGGGKSDWFIPSRDELTLLLDAHALIVDLSVSSYWSSTLAPVYGAWDQVIYPGSNYTSDETNAGSVRPIRAFG